VLRINLLSRDVLERRRYETWYPYVFITTAVLLGVLLFTGAILWYVGYSKQASLQQLHEVSQELKSQADAFGIFEQKEQDLLKRQTVAQAALADRINMGQVANDISLVLPDEVWLTGLDLSESQGAQLQGDTPQSPSQAMDVGYKSVASTLVALNELPQLSDVWLTSAANQTFSAWPVSALASGTVATPVEVVQFAAVSKLRTAAAASAGASSTAAAGSTTASGSTGGE
jgi:hypothetical protein